VSEAPSKARKGATSGSNAARMRTSVRMRTRMVLESTDLETAVLETTPSRPQHSSSTRDRCLAARTDTDRPRATHLDLPCLGSAARLAFAVVMRLGLFTLLALAAPAVGCTGAVADPAIPGDAEAFSTSAVVIVERTLDPSSTGGGPRSETSARFVRVSAPSSTGDALRTIGATVDLPAPGTCASLVSLADGVPSSTATALVELVDVGSVSLEVSGRETRLVPRQLPDVTDVVSGVVYARAADATTFPSSARYLLHVSGSPDIDPFDVAASAPADPADVQIDGEDANGLAVSTGAPIAFEWTTDATGDALYVDLQPGAIRCTLDGGSHPADAPARATVPAYLVDDAGTLVVHRMHREPIVAHGLASGEVRFDFSRSVPYLRH
jgi:hypothetical protein